jgi:hypothetical protein
MLSNKINKIMLQETMAIQALMRMSKQAIPLRLYRPIMRRYMVLIIKGRNLLAGK